VEAEGDGAVLGRQLAQGLKPAFIWRVSRGAEAPLFHGISRVREGGVRKADSSPARDAGSERQNLRQSGGLSMGEARGIFE
jgi:hypothetical protein